MTRTSLRQYRSADIRTCDPAELVDLRDITIDTSRPRSERMQTFLQQVHNPYLFKAEGLVVKAVYPPNASRKLADVLSHC